MMHVHVGNIFDQSKYELSKSLLLEVSKMFNIVSGFRGILFINSEVGNIDITLQNENDYTILVRVIYS